MAPPSFSTLFGLSLLALAPIASSFLAPFPSRSTGGDVAIRMASGGGRGRGGESCVRGIWGSRNVGSRSSSGVVSRVLAEASEQTAEEGVEQYVQCGKCKSVYSMDLATLGNGKKVTCSVCSHAWWQTADRVQTLRDGWMFADLSDERLDTIKENIAAGRAPNDEKPKVKGAVTVFIGNLPFNYGDSDIENIFKPFGEVASVTLVKQADGRSKGYAFVDMMEKPAGEKAIAELNGSDIEGRNLNVALGGDSK